MFKHEKKVLNQGCSKKREALDGKQEDIGPGAMQLLKKIIALQNLFWGSFESILDYER